MFQSAPAGRARSLTGKWRGLGGPNDQWIVLLLRIFLGLTFVYAGLQKLADRWFFQASAPSSLQSQLRGSAHTSPIAPLVGAAAHHAVLFGLCVAFGELAVGVGTVVGLWARAAAAAGLLLSLAFLLTVSWHSRPYYYGADVVFVFAWTPLVLGGAGRLSVDAMAAARAGKSWASRNPGRSRSDSTACSSCAATTGPPPLRRRPPRPLFPAPGSGRLRPCRSEGLPRSQTRRQATPPMWCSRPVVSLWPSKVFAPIRVAR